MSLLDKATIITTPTAHSNGVLHSVKGGSVADFDVVRGSAATRVNAEGLIEDISILSGELVTNGDFSNGSTDWSLDTGWSVSDGKATSDGTNLAYLTQASIIFTGVSYKVQFDIVDYTSGSIKYRDNGLVGGQSFSGVGSYTDYVVAGGGQFRLMSENFIGSIDNISVVEVIDATNIPRLDYTGGTASILLEPQSTNLITYSEDFSQWSAGGNTTIESGYLSPDGTNNAYKVSGTDNALALNVGLLTTTTRSVYARTVSGTGLANLCSFNSNTNNLFTITEQWQRFEVNSAISTGATSFYGVDFRGSTTLTEIILWGANATNDQDYATSYIPTEGAIATRLADSVTGAGDATTFNSTEGVLYFEGSALADDGTSRYITINDGSTSNFISISFYNNSTIKSRIAIGGASTFLTSGVVTQTDTFKVAIKYKLNDYALWINGVEVDSNNLLGVYAPNTLSNLDFSRLGTANPLLGKVKSVITFNTALTDAELECLTTI